MANNERLEKVAVSRSVLRCNECNRICYHDRKYSILSAVNIADSLLFKQSKNNCFMCYHSTQHHSRLINPKIIKQLFIDAKVNAYTKDICQRMKYLGGTKNYKQIINILSYESEAPYIWMNILWKSRIYTSAQQKIEFIKMLENEFEPDYKLQNNKGLTVIHFLCLHDDIIDAETSQLLLLYFREESKYIKNMKKDIFTSVCHSKRTPLHYAVEFGKVESIKILIDLYDNKTLSLKDDKKQTVMDIARQQKHSNIVKYLQQYKIDEEKKEDLYHEKQEWEMCLVHAINSLLQKKKYTAKELNKICKQMAPDKIINPHKSILQTGNYDANVLIMALNKVNIDVQWFDARKVNELDLSNKAFLQPDNKLKLIGFILNNPQKTMLFLNRRHWLAIKKIDDYWYNLDSKLDNPKKWDAYQATKFLKNALKKNSAELMICRQRVPIKYNV